MERTQRTRIRTPRITEPSTGNAPTGNPPETAAQEIEVEPLPRPPVDLFRCRHCGFPLEPERVEPVRWTRTGHPSPRGPVAPN
jgi:hypothetical protein